MTGGLEGALKESGVDPGSVVAEYRAELAEANRGIDLYQEADPPLPVAVRVLSKGVDLRIRLEGAKSLYTMLTLDPGSWPRLHPHFIEVLHAGPAIPFGDGRQRTSAAVEVADPEARFVPADERREATEDAGLTERQVEVLQAVADGLENPEIGVRLHISPNTVKVHRAKVMARLGVNSAAHAVAAGFRLGLIA